MWIYQNVEGNFLETDPVLSFSGFPNFTSDHQWADQLPATSSTSPDTALLSSVVISLWLSTDTYMSQLPFHDGFYLGADVDATSKVTDADNWEKFCRSMASINNASQSDSPAGSSPMPGSSASCSTSFSLPSAFSASEISGFSSGAMGSSPGRAYPPFSDDSENCEPLLIRAGISYRKARSRRLWAGNGRNQICWNISVKGVPVQSKY
ncbi:hypothetical protein C8R45DRAFT_993366 [Mycena sanguinolenta]|nr:hypothetical protein C8R45DRAFT_993366 [Mycena sanguinolenta]